MGKLLEITERITYKILEKLIEYRISNTSKQSKEAKLRQTTHKVEKGQLEGKTYTLDLIKARNLYFGLKNDGEIPSVQEKWYKKILFGLPEESEENDEIKEYNDEITEVIKSRRSIREWKEEKLDKDEFKRIIDAARWAPNSCNRNPWRFLLVKEKENIDFIYSVRGQEFLKNAPNCLIVMADKTAYPESEDFVHTSRLDLGVAIQNILLESENMGLGGCITNLNIDEESKEQIKNYFGLSEDLDLVCLIPIGKMKSKPSPPPRIEVEEIIYFDTF